MNSITRAVSFAALAGLAVQASAQSFTIHITADVTSVSVGDVITWTVSVTGDFAAGEYVYGYDFNLVASNPGLGTASVFSDALQPVVAPTPGTPSGTSILGASGGQSSLLSGNNQVAGAVVLGTFTVTQGPVWGTLSYTIEDGGVLGGTDVLRTKLGSDFVEGFNGVPTVITDTVGLIPAPSGAAVILAPIALASTRRRRRA